MDKGYYVTFNVDPSVIAKEVAIHNKNGQGLLRQWEQQLEFGLHSVAIHNKNGQGLLHPTSILTHRLWMSQSTIKMDKGYYHT